MHVCGDADDEYQTYWQIELILPSPSQASHKAVDRDKSVVDEEVKLVGRTRAMELSQRHEFCYSKMKI